MPVLLPSCISYHDIHGKTCLLSLLSVGLVCTNHVRDVASPMLFRSRFAFCTRPDYFRSKHWRPDSRGDREGSKDLQYGNSPAVESGVERLKKKRNCAEQLLRSLSVDVSFTAPKYRSSLRAFAYGDDRWVLQFPFRCDVIKWMRISYISTTSNDPPPEVSLTREGIGTMPSQNFSQSAQHRMVLELTDDCRASLDSSHWFRRRRKEVFSVGINRVLPVTTGGTSFGRSSLVFLRQETPLLTLPACGYPRVPPDGTRRWRIQRTTSSSPNASCASNCPAVPCDK